ncbi:UNVERIFIED_CONTAM: hypothetical protein Slati_0401200 [Sesamum latifolium]|uniref:Uncharacterized protein n=1 Tax=Sesamum latifolium TaxID=2727402 RepID=A0AAW2Y006_9LAMI
MEAHLRGLLLWDAIESVVGAEIPENPTLDQLEVYEEHVSRKYRALITLHAAVDETIFSRSIACKIAKEVWDNLKTELQGSEKNK